MEATDPIRRPGWAIVAALVLTLAGLTAVPASTAVNHELLADEACTPHPPIEITEEHGSQGFTWTNPATGETEHRPGSGVVAGSGTAEDPYVIEGWCIAYADDGFRVDGEQVSEHTDRGIQIEGTVSHVEIRDNVVGVAPFGDAAVAIEDTEHIRIGSNRIVPLTAADLGTTFGIYAGSSTDVEIVDNDLLRAGETGISVDGSEDVEIRRNDLADGLDDGIRVDETDGVSVRGNIVTDHGRAAIDLSRVSGGYVAENKVEENRYGIAAGDGQDNVIERNHVEDSTLGIALYSGSASALVEHNDVFDNDDGVWLHEAVEPDVEDNLLHGNERGVYAHGSEGVEVHGNNINASATVGLTTDESVDTVDASHNWWGCPDGPDDPACDDVEGDVVVDPWLTEPNPDAGSKLAWPADPDPLPG